MGVYQAIRIKCYRDSLTREGNIYILFHANLRSKSTVVTFGRLDVEERTRNTDLRDRVRPQSLNDRPLDTYLESQATCQRRERERKRAWAVGRFCIFCYYYFL